MRLSLVPRSSKQIKLHPESQRSRVNTLGSRILAILSQQACFVLRVSSKVKLGRACCQPWCCCLVCGEGYRPRHGALLHATALFASSLLLPQFSEANEVLHNCRPTAEELLKTGRKREQLFQLTLTSCRANTLRNEAIVEKCNSHRDNQEHGHI